MLQLFSKSVQKKCRQSLNNPHTIASSLSSLGYLYHDKGDLEQAFQYHTESLAIRQKIGNSSLISNSLHNLANIYFDKNEKHKAKALYQESLVILKQIGNKLHIAEILFDLIQFRDLDSKEYLNELLLLSQESDNKLIMLRARLSNAIQLSNDTRMLKKSQAQLLLNELLATDLDGVNSRFLVIQALCETLLFELQAAGDPEVYTEVKKFIKELNTISNDIQSTNYAAEALLLKARLAVFENKISQASHHLEQTMTMTEEKQFW